MTDTPERTGFMAWHDPYHVMLDSPYNHDRVWIWRKEWPEPHLVVVRDLNEAMNVMGLLWRPVDQPGAIERGRVEIDGEASP